MEILGVHRLRLFHVLLHFRYDHSAAKSPLTDHRADIGTVRDTLGNDILCPLQGSFSVLHILLRVHKVRGTLKSRHLHFLRKDLLRKRFQSSLFCDRCSCAAFRAVRQVQIFQRRLCRGLFDLLPELIRQFALLLNRSKDQFLNRSKNHRAPLLQRPEIAKALI